MKASQDIRAESLHFLLQITTSLIVLGQGSIFPWLPWILRLGFWNLEISIYFVGFLDIIITHCQVYQRSCTRVDLPLFCFFPELWLLFQQSPYLLDKFESEYYTSKNTLTWLNTRFDNQCTLTLNNVNCRASDGSKAVNCFIGQTSVPVTIASLLGTVTCNETYMNKQQWYDNRCTCIFTYKGLSYIWTTREIL